jgi:alanyl-tRNA synthetase
LDILEEEGNKFLNSLLKVDGQKNEALRMINRIKEGEKDQKDEKWLKYYSKIAKIDIIEDWKNLKIGEKNYEYAYKKVSPAVAFALETTHAYSHEMFFEDLKIKFGSAAKWINIIKEEYAGLFRQHQELSRTASAGMFKGGLADTSEATKKYHTAAHLLLSALRKVLGEHVFQKGSNITQERLRFDFSHPDKMTDEEKIRVEQLVNEAISVGIPISCQVMSLEEAKKQGAMGVFENKYGDNVKVYTVAPFEGEIFSKEICGGPHVDHTGKLGKFRIIKEESSSAGVRRIKAILE